MATLRHALRLHRHRLQHHARARRRGGGRAAARGAPAARVHAHRQGPEGRRARSRARRSTRSRDVVAAQRRLAEQVGAEPLRVVATAAIRGAANRDEFVAVAARARRRRGLDPRRRGGGAAGLPRRHAHARAASSRARVGVVDVGGGSTEIAVGTLAGGVTWSGSFRRRLRLPGRPYLRSDPPAAAELHAMREHAGGVFEGLEVPQPDCAVAVGGSAASLRRLVGAVLEPETLQRALRVLSGEPAADVARRFELDPERVRPAARRDPHPRRRLAPPRLPAADRPRRPARGRPAGAGGGERLDGQGRRRRAGRRTSRSRARARASCACARRSCSTHAEGVLDTEDIERVHDMRVATRRLRAVLEIFAPCFPQAEFKAALRDVKALADALGERRDPDVHIDAMEAFAARRRRRAQRPGRARRCVARLRERQVAGNAVLAEALEHAERSDLRGRLLALAGRGGRSARREGAQGQGARPGARRWPTTPSGSCARGSDELCGFMPQAADPARGRGAARHADRRQAAALRARGHRALLRALRRAPRSSTSRSSRTCSARSTTATCSCPEVAAFLEELVARRRRRASVAEAETARPNQRPAATPGLVGAPGPPAGPPRAAVRALPGALGRPRAQGLPRAARIRGGGARRAVPSCRRSA